MKRAAYITLFMLFSLVLAACATPADEPAAADVGIFITDLGGRDVTIMVENEYPPFNSLDVDTDEGIGWDYDTWNEICSRLNCNPVFTEAAWPPFEMMAAGELDVAADGITLKLGRSMIIDYSDPYIEYGMVMMMRTDKVFETNEDFENSDARIASQAGTTNEAAALALVGEGRVDNYGEWPIAVEALLAGDADGVAIDDVAAVAWIQENPGELMTGFHLTSGEFLAFVYPPGSPLIGPVNAVLQDMLNDGTLDAICQKWLLRNCSPDEE
ncbi:MAG: amino acid ABC transporter substrate-binding protein [Chloroflexi bacterium]|nr:amino acid ABC transporter substrate-binding protein [Chloroflexota bacterium]